MNIDGLATVLELALGFPVAVQRQLPVMASPVTQAKGYLEVRTVRELGLPQRRQSYNATTNLISTNIVTEHLGTFQLRVESMMGSDIFTTEFLSQLRGVLYKTQTLAALLDAGFGLSRINVVTMVPGVKNDTAILEFDLVFSESIPDVTDASWIEHLGTVGSTLS